MASVHRLDRSGSRYVCEASPAAVFVSHGCNAKAFSWLNASTPTIRRKKDYEAAFAVKREEMLGTGNSSGAEIIGHGSCGGRGCLLKKG